MRLTLTAEGEYLVQEVTRRRRSERTRIVDTVPELWHEPLTAALKSLAASAGEPADSEWWLGWHNGATERRED